MANQYPSPWRMIVVLDSQTILDTALASAVVSGLVARLNVIKAWCLRFVVILFLAAAMSSASAWAQSNTQNSTDTSENTSASSSLGENTASILSFNKPRHVSIIGLDDSADSNELEQLILDKLENLELHELLDVFAEHSLTVDLDKTTDSTLVLRSVVAVSAQERLAKYIRASNYDEVEDILKQEDVDVNAGLAIGDYYSFTPITLAASNHDLEMVELLLSYRADPDAFEDEEVLTALGHAVMGHNVEVTKALLDAGASIEFDHAIIGREPLALWAAQTDDPTLMTLLIDKGVDPSKVGNHGWTPLAEAIRLGNLEVAELIVGKSDPRMLTVEERSYSIYNRFDGRYFPSGNALFFARHFLEPDRAQPLINRILERTRVLGGNTAVSLLRLQAYRSASKLAYSAMNLQASVEQSQNAMDVVDVLAFDSRSDEALVETVKIMLGDLHELCVIAGVPFSQENRARAEHIGKISNDYAKWHDMLDVMNAAKDADATALIEQWRAEHGDPAQSGWNYEMLLEWADTITYESDRNRVYATIGVFRSASIFK